MTEGWSITDQVEHLRQVAVYGDVELGADGRPAPREEPEPWKHFLVGGRGYGKSAALEDWLAEMRRKAEEQRRKEAELARMVGSWRAAPPVRGLKIAGVRWVCSKPTDPAPLRGSGSWWDWQSVLWKNGEKSLADIVAEARAGGPWER
jgi:hypothetical protein